MHLKRLPFWLIASVLCTALPTHAQDNQVSSPFLPAGLPTSSAPGQTDPNSLQLRGIMNLGSLTKYCIYDPAKKSSVWLAVNQPGEGFVLASADSSHGTVTLDQQGRKVTLEIQNNHVSTASISVKNRQREPLTPEQQLKLKAIADIVRRKQQEREQSLSLGIGNALKNPDPAASADQQQPGTTPKPPKGTKRSKAQQ